jgi:Gpi18-like mannosyltransferase
LSIIELLVPATLSPPGVTSRHVATAAWRCAAALVDFTIAGCALALLIVLLTGGVDLGWLSITRASRPFVVLCILVPLRVTRPGTAWAERFASCRNAFAPAVRCLQTHALDSVRAVAFASVMPGIGVILVGFVANLLYPPDRVRPWGLPFDKPMLADTFAAWDSGWYFDIASRGYYYSSTGESSVAFSPLYPLAMRALAWPFGSSAEAIWAAGIAISICSSLVGLMVLYNLTLRMLGDPEIARRTVLYLSVFPFSFFLSRVYPSGLFLLLSVLSISAAVRSRWGWAGICGALAALARPQGILIVIPLALMAMNGGGRDSLVRLTSLVPMPLAFIGFHVYIGALAGEPLAWSASEAQWGYSLGNPPWDQLLALFSNVERHGLYHYFQSSDLAPYQLFHGVAALFLLACVPAVFTRIGAPLGCYVLASLLVPLSGNALSGIGRYGAVLFPVFMMLATIKSQRMHEVLLIVWSLFLALFVGLFVTWHPIY